MRYVIARLTLELRETTYRFYLTDALYGLGQNMHMKVRYKDILKGELQPKETDGNKIVEDVVKRAGLTIKE